MASRRNSARPRENARDRGTSDVGGTTRREVVVHARFQEDLRWWVETDRRLALRVFDLMDAVVRDPFAGIGKPEPLRGEGANCWSRRINDEHRLVYVVEHSRVVFIQARYHYQR